MHSENVFSEQLLPHFSHLPNANAKGCGQTFHATYTQCQPKNGEQSQVLIVSRIDLKCRRRRRRRRQLTSYPPPLPHSANYFINMSDSSGKSGGRRQLPATLNGRATAACNQQGEGVIDSQAAEAAGELSRNFQSRLRHILFMKLLPFSTKE